MSKIIYLTESNFTDISIVNESFSNGEKAWYISGTFLQSDVINRNKRIYPKTIMENTVNDYIVNYVNSKRAVGELEHPESPKVNLDKISHIIENITQEGNNFIGKAKILNTPCGKIAQGLLEGGVQLGVSSRGSGTVNKNKKGINEVQNDFKISAIDIVYAPSAPDAFVRGLMEGHKFGTIYEDEEYMTELKNTLDENYNFKLQEEKIKAFENFLSKFLKEEAADPVVIAKLTRSQLLRQLRLAQAKGDREKYFLLKTRLAQLDQRDDKK